MEVDLFILLEFFVFGIIVGGLLILGILLLFRDKDNIEEIQELTGTK